MDFCVSSRRAVWKATIQAHVPAVPARTAVYLYSSRWPLALHMPTDCQWQEGMDRFHPANLSAARPNHTLLCSPQTAVPPPLRHPAPSPRPMSLWTQAANAGPAASWLTKTTERLREATSQTKHAKPAGLHSQTEQTHKFNNDGDVWQPLRWWQAVAASRTHN